jgi:hypothetical protein
MIYQTYPNEGPTSLRFHSSWSTPHPRNNKLFNTIFDQAIHSASCRDGDRARERGADSKEAMRGFDNDPIETLRREVKILKIVTYTLALISLSAATYYNREGIQTAGEALSKKWSDVILPSIYESVNKVVPWIRTHMGMNSLGKA